LREAAELYNRNLLSKRSRWHQRPAEHAEYMALLNPMGTNVIGYVNIPKIRVTLPIYHTTDDSVLNMGVGHFIGSSLPVGGENTHSVLTGHRGLPASTLFTNLDRLQEGDIFFLHVLREVLTYEVDQIRIVEPLDKQHLEIEEGEDLCTLLTCTPYGVNSHRLLVRGRRIETPVDIRLTADAVRLSGLLVMPMIAAPILLAMFGALMLKGRKRRKVVFQWQG